MFEYTGILCLLYSMVQPLMKVILFPQLLHRCGSTTFSKYALSRGAVSDIRDPTCGAFFLRTRATPTKRRSSATKYRLGCLGRAVLFLPYSKSPSFMLPHRR